MSKHLTLNPDLNDDGTPSPKAVARNRNTYGFNSPRDEYVESVEVPTDREQAVRWHTSQAHIGRWRKAQKWDDQRARYWAEIERLRSEMTQEAIAELQAKTLQKDLAFWGALADALRAVLEKGVVDVVSPKGFVVQRPLDPKDLKDAAQTGDIIRNGIHEAIGFNKAMLKTGSAEEIEPPQRVSRIVYRQTVTVEQEDMTPELLPESIYPALPVETMHEPIEATIEG